MITIENIEINGLKAAIRGMRNPMNSWEKSDSRYCNTHGPAHCLDCKYLQCGCNADDGDIERNYIIGPNDLKLAQNLIKSGTDHSKFMRMINVTMDINAPLYWWKEMDTYKIGTVRDSCSTMHKIHSKEFILNDFSHEHLLPHTEQWLIQTIITLNEYRDSYLKTKNKKYWWQLIQLLPASYNQRATWQANYQVLRNIYFSRRNHKLDEWYYFCNMIESLPYGKELICNKGG